MAARLLVGRQLHHMSPLSSLSCMRVYNERDSESSEETGRVRSSRESLRASAATHTQREREREVNGSTPPRGTAAASHVSSLLSAMHARAHGERQWEPRGNGTGTEQQREPAGLCSHTHAVSDSERRMAARLLVGWQLHHMSPLGSLPCACARRETVGAARKRDRYGAAERACGPLQPHTRRERERERRMAARLRVGRQPHHTSPRPRLPCACTLRETVGAARKRDRYGAAERACGPLQPHTRREREREREVNGSTPPRGMAAASHVSSLLSAMRVHTERDSGSREETGPVRSSGESLRASAATHMQRERERGEWQHASSWDGSL